MSLSDLFSRLVEMFGSEITPPKFPGDDIFPPTINKPKPPPKKYAPLRDAVESKLEHLVRYEIPEHRELAKDDMLELYYVEIESMPEGQALLDAFCKEFSPASRQQWVRDFLGANATVKLDGFTGVYRNAELPSTDHLDQHSQLLNQGTPSAYRVHLWSKWSQATLPKPGKGNAVVLRIHDAQGEQAGIHRETYPIKIGRQGDITVSGTYASTHHCTLHWHGGQVELEDHSTNGTWIDGAKLHRQSKLLSLGKHSIKLGKGQGDVNDWPEIELDILAEKPQIHATPTPVVISDATPIVISEVTPIATDAPVLLGVLSVQDATGNPHIDVLRLPFSIGRGAKYDYATPSAHVGVSGSSGPHLVIEAINAEGAEVLNEAHSKNGTLLGGVLQGGRFLWPFGEEITLAPKWKDNPPVRICLKRPG